MIALLSYGKKPVNGMLSDIRVSIRFRISQVKWYVVEKYRLYVIL